MTHTVHLTNMTFVDAIDPTSAQTQVLVTDQTTTKRFSYEFPATEEVIYHDLIIKAKHVNRISLIIGGQVVSTNFKFDNEGNFHLSRPNFLAPFAHQYHDLRLQVEFSQPSSVTLERVISLPSIEVVKQLTSQPFHCMSICDGSCIILKYASGLVGVLKMTNLIKLNCADRLSLYQNS